MDNPTISVLSMASEREKSLRSDFIRLFKQSPIPESEVTSNLGLFLTRQTLSRILFLHDLYTMILNVHGVVMEFGTRWGQNLALFGSCRGIYEPYNYSRKIIGFDTFSGFPKISDKDSTVLAKGDYGVSEDYESYLDRVLSNHEQQSPLSHIRKHELVKGDLPATLSAYLENHRETIVALAYFDLDIYEPTKSCLEIIKNYLPKGAVVAFDELNHPAFPGETVALQESIGIANCRLIRSPLNPTIAYFVID